MLETESQSVNTSDPNVDTERRKASGFTRRLVSGCTRPENWHCARPPRAPVAGQRASHEQVLASRCVPRRPGRWAVPARIRGGASEKAPGDAARVDSEASMRATVSGRETVRVWGLHKVQTPDELSSARRREPSPREAGARSRRTPPSGLAPPTARGDAARGAQSKKRRNRAAFGDAQRYGFAASPSSSGAFVCLMKICAAQMPISYSRHIGTASASWDTTSGGVITAATMKATTTK